MHIQKRTGVCAQAHMCTQTQIRTQNIKQRATPAQWRCVVLPLRRGFIGFYVTCRSIPLVKTHCLDSSEQQLQRSGSPRRSLSTSTAFLSAHYNQWRAPGETWSLAGWLNSLQSAGCERGHLSRALRVPGEREGEGCKGLFQEQWRIRNTLSLSCTGQGFPVKTYTYLTFS